MVIAQDENILNTYVHLSFLVFFVDTDVKTSDPTCTVQIEKACICVVLYTKILYYNMLPTPQMHSA
jgi:hypothetical protein